MNLIDAFINRSRATITFIILICISGIYSYLNIPVESKPDVKVPIIYVTVPYDGISPEDSERLLVRPLENQLRNIVGLKELTSYSYEGSAQIVVEFFAGLDTESSLRTVRDAVQDAKSKLPAGAKEPIVKEVNLSLFPVLNIILSGDLPERTLLSIARDLKSKLEGASGVLEVQLAGDKIDTLEIVIKPEILDGYNISIQQLGQLIDSNNRLVAAGTIRTRGADFSVKVPSIIKDYKTLMDFPIKVDGDKIIKLSDIAEVRRTFKDCLSVARVNGKPSIMLSIIKKTGENIINTVSTVKNITDNERQFWPAQVNLDYQADESGNIKEMVLDLENNIIISVFLVMMVVIMSVGTRSALLISLSIPVSFFVGILILDVSQLSLNIVVLFSLILTVGMIVDDAIVVSEYADRIMHNGVPPEQAFSVAAKRMLWPIVTSTLVKIVVFLPLLFWPGVIGQFFKYMPITVIAILGSSLIFALFFQPTLGPLFGKPSNLEGHIPESLQAADHGDLSNLQGYTKKYHELLELVLNKPKKFVSVIIGSLVAVYIAFALFGAGFEFFPDVEPEFTLLTIQSPGNLSFQEKEGLIKEIEKKLLPFSKEVRIFAAVASDFSKDNSSPKDTIISVNIEFIDWQKRRKAAYIIKDMTKAMQEVKGVNFEFFSPRGGPSAGKPIEVNISSWDFEKIEYTANALLQFMRKEGNFKDIDSSLSSNNIEWQIITDRVEAARYKVDINTVGNLISLVTDGLKISSYRPDDVDDEVDIVLRFPKEDRGVLMLNSINVVNIDGKLIPLSNIVERKAARAVDVIKKVNKERTVTIKSDVKAGELVDTKLKLIKDWALHHNPNPEVKIHFKGEDQDMQETSIFLRNAFSLTLFMMFMIMLIQFNNIYHTVVVMSAVFLSTVGVIIGLLITYQPFGVVMCGIGIIALGGIVLNNNILFLDTYQHLRKEGMDVHEAIVRSGVQRIRPILLTAATAILGLIPMIFGLTINLIDREITIGSPSTQWWKQLAASIAGGLSFATILTLFFTPCLLKIGARFDSYKTTPATTKVTAMPKPQRISRKK